jgi:hypothetical protein
VRRDSRTPGLRLNCNRDCAADSPELQDCPTSDWRPRRSAHRFRADAAVSSAKLGIAAARVRLQRAATRHANRGRRRCLDAQRKLRSSLQLDADLLRQGLRRHHERSERLWEMRQRVSRRQLLRCREMRDAGVYGELRERRAVLRKRVLRRDASVLRGFHWTSLRLAHLHGTVGRTDSRPRDVEGAPSHSKS